MNVEHRRGEEQEAPVDVVRLPINKSGSLRTASGSIHSVYRCAASEVENDRIAAVKNGCCYYARLSYLIPLGRRARGCVEMSRTMLNNSAFVLRISPIMQQLHLCQGAALN